jgi:hypothetical protein
VISTIKSPAFSEVLVSYWEADFYNSVYSTTYPEDKQAALGGEAAWYHTQFDAFREMYKARDFRLVLKASNVSDDSVRELKRAVAAEKAREGFPPAVCDLHLEDVLRAQKCYPLWVLSTYASFEARLF